MTDYDTLNSPRGSLWNRWDLHVHSPASYDYKNKDLSAEEMVDSLLKANLRVVAITDHHTIDVEYIREMQIRGNGRLTIFPGIELRSDHGGKPIHYICIFPDDCDLSHVWTTLQGRLGLTPPDLASKGGDERIYVPIEKAADVTRELRGIISIHAGEKSNSIEGIKNREQFQQRIKYDITSQYVDMLEIGQLKDIERHLTTIFPATGLEKPLILCSDNHNAIEYSTKAPLWFRADPTFRGLLMVIREPRDRIYIGSKPPELARVELNPTKYVRALSFSRDESAPVGQQWFDGKVVFNPGLVAIVGNKGSGKSALANSLGLVGATEHSSAFSFLNIERFRHPKNGHASHFESAIEWESGEVVTKSLADPVNPEEVERLKYLPQNHVDKICNELMSAGAEGFEQELKNVIFSHVPEPSRLGYSNLDDLVRFQNGEKQNRIDTLQKQLRDLNRSRVELETKADPAVRAEIQQKIKQRKVELETHEKAKPEVVPNPSELTDASQTDSQIPQELKKAEVKRDSIATEISLKTQSIELAERQSAVARRLIEKIDNFEKDFHTFRASIVDDAKEIGVAPNELVKLLVGRAKPEEILERVETDLATALDALDSEEPPGLRRQLDLIQTKITTLQMELDAPNRAYQAYLTQHAEWEAKRNAIIGDTEKTDSLNGLEHALSELDELPTKVRDVQGRQEDVAIQIHAEKAAQAEVYRRLYSTVQDFIDAHPLARDKLQLEFRVELTSESFSQRLLGVLSQNRKGTFMGVEDGRANAESMVGSTRWEEVESVREFLRTVDDALHFNHSKKHGESVLLKDQLAKGHSQEDVFDIVYGLDHLRPRYILRWEGKDLSMLSPGERGTLLLIFYLLVDKSDLPLIIDQPEGNLDNHTVAKVLVDCIRDARKRRQVFIVTHNPNLAVVCDADQVVHAEMDKKSGNKITYTTGSLENPTISKYVTDVLEGTMWAFRIRDDKYMVGAING